MVASAQQVFTDATRTVQDVLSNGLPAELSSQLSRIAASSQAGQPRLPATEVNDPLAGPAAQASAALSSISRTAQQAVSSLHLPEVQLPDFSRQGRGLAPGLDLDALAQQARDAASRLVPDLPGPGPGSLFGRSDLPPHFGTRAAEQALQQASGWAALQGQNLQAANPQARLYLHALSSQLKAAQDLLQQTILNPVQEIPHLLDNALSPGVNVLRDASSSILSSQYLASLTTWLKGVTTVVQSQSAPCCPPFDQPPNPTVPMLATLFDATANMHVHIALLTNPADPARWIAARDTALSALSWHGTLLKSPLHSPFYAQALGQATALC